MPNVSAPSHREPVGSGEGVSQSSQGTWSHSHGLTHASRSYQPVQSPAQECPPRDPSLCWPSRDRALPPPWHPNAPSLSPVPSSLRPTGKCLLYCNGVLEPLYLCPDGALCATWFQDPTHFTGTMDAFMKIVRHKVSGSCGVASQPSWYDYDSHCHPLQLRPTQGLPWWSSPDL